MRRLTWWQELLLLVVVAVLVALVVRTYAVETFWIPSGSMEQTLRTGDQVLVDKVTYHWREPRRGEVVVFRGVDGWSAPEGTASGSSGPVDRLLRAVVGGAAPGENDFVKRVVGVPGDVVACCDRGGHVTVNGVALHEPYVYEDSPVDAPPSPGECRSRRFPAYRVRAGQLFVLGDHRGVSQDSRCQGPVPLSAVIGRAVAVAWPPGHWRTVPVPDTFRRVPD
ncbi:signal peptidase I [Actinocatenispora rupis]|uniref:Signal peptidase I n=1 Tax=Actinocatenispora rupis TaxID=519421 RepID=A0A8J3J2S8_9ACTN|nr:signal peptidase I [Actinocatenispora rupis]GID09117.1 hypothetical protein Aru02nite_00060 [Actinocatenispora rupis]